MDIVSMLKKFPRWLIYSTVVIYIGVGGILFIINSKLKMPLYTTNEFYFTISKHSTASLKVQTRQLLTSIKSGSKVKILVYFDNGQPSVLLKGVVSQSDDYFFILGVEKNNMEINTGKTYFGKLTVLSGSASLSKLITNRFN